jgi:lactate dehydrogenase-like 2-hydroxyacid dehydrogenase
LGQAPTLRTPQNYTEESSFDCQLSEEDLKKKIQKFIEEERDQKDFYLENSNDKIYNELREKEEKALKSIFTSFKKDYLNEIELKYK